MNEKDLLDSLVSQQTTMLEQVWQWSNINSGSSNLAGLAAMHAEFKQVFSSIGDSVETIKLDPIEQVNMEGEQIYFQSGDCLLVRKRPKAKQRILLGGHMDTVFNLDHHFQQVKQIDDNSINGPGVTDMKGGIAVMLHALKAFEQSDYASSIGWDIFINADEELGSPASGQLLEKMADDYQYALVYEPAMNPSGTLAYERKGSGKFTIVVKGVAAHAGRDFDRGCNAIAHSGILLTQIAALNGQRPGLTINIGMISGGKALNIVAETAVFKLDVRFSHRDDKAWLLKQLNDIIDQANKTPALQVSLHGDFGRPRKAINDATAQLFQMVKAQADKLGVELGWKPSGGCCDGNNLAHSGLPVVDTLGVRGNHIHSDKEYLLIDSLVERAQLSTLILIELSKQLSRTAV